ncbi:hypothetical protein AVEN_191217-1 [Araneus ventricosus]|uniref:Uncharacterized protein n=1 Tax=Araneus ventricosus TaxID=182803 RepID=A0A4Y2U153_ARAVE|nr:hypothetical protein AVEN_191217-1 [Araneus ventricosus]
MEIFPEEIGLFCRQARNHATPGYRPSFLVTKNYQISLNPILMMLRESRAFKIRLSRTITVPSRNKRGNSIGKVYLLANGFRYRHSALSEAASQRKSKQFPGW